MDIRGGALCQDWLWIVSLTQEELRALIQGPVFNIGRSKQMGFWAKPGLLRIGSALFCMGVVMQVCVLAGGQTHGVLLMNSNGMDIVITDSKISYRMIGGVADFYFFLGPTPNAVLEQLTSVVGRPMMAPYWSLGLMNSK